jgi:putative endonuclease
MDERRIFGNAAEDLAAAFLIEKGMVVTHRQYRTRAGEIDVVAQDGDEIVFVEVKARNTNEFGYPEESVTRQKLAKIMHAGEVFLKTHNLESSRYRIDVVAIEFYENPPKVTHLIGVG